MKHSILLSATAALVLSSCSENYSNGERIGVVTQFSSTGIIWKSHEGHLNVTQTGMNSSVPFDFSVDNDNEPVGVVPTLDSAAQHGWKVKLNYHETMGWNWFGNRGSTNHFVTSVEVLEKDFGNAFNGHSSEVSTGRTIDTVFVVVVPRGSINPEWFK
jgi:hypothetical protein